MKLDWLIIKKSTADLLVMLKYAKKGPGEYGIGGIHVHCQGSLTPLVFNSFGKSLKVLFSEIKRFEYFFFHQIFSKLKYDFLDFTFMYLHQGVVV